MARLSKLCTAPLGQRIVKRLNDVALAKPKMHFGSSADMNPRTDGRSRICRPPSPDSTVTTAPIAMRLLCVPMSLNATRWFSPPSFR